MFADQSEALDAAGGGNSLEDLLTRCFDFAFGLILQRRLIINNHLSVISSQSFNISISHALASKEKQVVRAISQKKFD